MTGRKQSTSSLTTIFSLEDINLHFQHINTDPSYVQPQRVPLSDDTKIPHVDEFTPFMFLTKLKRTTAGPDELPFWLWKEFALELSPIITRIFNLYIKLQAVPKLWKLDNVNPIPKEFSITEKEQLRPISITDIIMRIFERIIYKQEVKHTLFSFLSLLGRTNLLIKRNATQLWPYLSVSTCGYNGWMGQLNMSGYSLLTSLRRLSWCPIM